jgi:hypothetical protein
MYWAAGGPHHNSGLTLENIQRHSHCILLHISVGNNLNSLSANHVFTVDCMFW